jgi:SAM-dependent methyltransferase
LWDLAVPGLLTYSFVTRWDLDQAVASLNLGPGRLLLDLACGQGGPGLWLAERTGCGLVGVDFSEAGLQVARERAEGLLPGPRTRFQRGDLAATGLEDSSVDGVWCGDAFFFASDLVEALGEVRRVLRPGGRLVTTVWCVAGRSAVRASLGLASVAPASGFAPAAAAGDTPRPGARDGDVCGVDRERGGTTRRASRQGRGRADRRGAVGGRPVGENAPGAGRRRTLTAGSAAAG